MLAGIAGFGVEDDAVGEDGDGEGADVVGGDVVAGGHEGPSLGAAEEAEGAAGAEAEAEADIVAGELDESDDVVGDGGLDADAADGLLHAEDVGGGDDRGEVVVGVVVVLGVEDLEFGGVVGVADGDADGEAVELGFGEGVGALILGGVLGGDDEERGGEGAGDAIRGDCAFAHDFE